MRLSKIMGFLIMTNNPMDRRQFLKSSAIAGSMLLSINLPFIKLANANKKYATDLVYLR
jgi:hypothetical protein